MSSAFKLLTDQGKQNNKTFINDLPYFGIIKDPSSNKNIIPLTDKNDFTNYVELRNLYKSNLYTITTILNFFLGVIQFR